MPTDSEHEKKASDLADETAEIARIVAAENASIVKVLKMELRTFKTEMRTLYAIVILVVALVEAL